MSTNNSSSSSSSSSTSSSSTSSFSSSSSSSTSLSSSTSSSSSSGAPSSSWSNTTPHSSKRSPTPAATTGSSFGASPPSSLQAMSRRNMPTIQMETLPQTNRSMNYRSMLRQRLAVMPPLKQNRPFEAGGERFMPAQPYNENDNLINNQIAAPEGIRRLLGTANIPWMKVQKMKRSFRFQITNRKAVIFKRLKGGQIAVHMSNQEG